MAVEKLTRMHSYLGTSYLQLRFVGLGKDVTTSENKTKQGEGGTGVERMHFFLPVREHVLAGICWSSSAPHEPPAFFACGGFPACKTSVFESVLGANPRSAAESSDDEGWGVGENCIRCAALELPWRPRRWGCPQGVERVASCELRHPSSTQPLLASSFSLRNFFVLTRRGFLTSIHSTPLLSKNALHFLRRRRFGAPLHGLLPPPPSSLSLPLPSRLHSSSQDSPVLH